MDNMALSKTTSGSPAPDRRVSHAHVLQRIDSRVTGSPPPDRRVSHAHVLQRMGSRITGSPSPDRRVSHAHALQRMGSRRVIKTPFPSHKKKPPLKYQFGFDNAIKGWRERSRGDTALSRWGKARGVIRTATYFQKLGGHRKTADTVLNIDVKSLVKATLTKKMMASEAVEKQEESEEETLRKTLTEPSTIPKPFVRSSDTINDGVWICPSAEAPCTERTKQFAWEKPRVERRELVESAASYQVIYLEKMLKEKTQEMKLITNQLLKANKENVSLIKELEGYRGKNYDELLKENISLKDQMARISRDNNVLVGQIRQNSNKLLHRWSLRRERSAL